MKIYLNSDRSGGHPDAVHKIPGTKWLLHQMFATLANKGANIHISFWYDVCGERSPRNPNDSLIQKSKI